MRLHFFIAVAAIALSACGESDSVSAAKVETQTQRIEFEQAGASRQPETPDTDNTCPEGAASNRPADANCYGVMPAECGADRAAELVGREIDSGLRGRIDAMSKSGTRYLEEEPIVPDEIERGRLNVLLDENDVIVSFNCY